MPDIDLTAYYNIAFSFHKIMNPLSEETLRFIGENCLARSPILLDIGSGKGYASLYFARTFGARTVQVDCSQRWTAEARRLFTAHGLVEGHSFHTSDAAEFEVETGRYDMILCLGTTPVFGGFEPALEKLVPGLKESGVLVVGELSADGELPRPFQRYLSGHEWSIYSSKEIFSMIREQGLETLFVLRSSPADWDAYMSLQWKAVSDHALARAGDPEAESFLALARREQEMYVRYQRHHLDWNVFVLRQDVRRG
jgi:SAM-dependent methyltransferase